MQSVIVFACVLAVASAGVVAPLAYTSVVQGATSSQFHSQDELGQYSYGYSGGPSAKTESKDAFGNVRGQYSFVDANGLIQNANYIADPVNGFRVARTDLPVGPSQVVAAAPAVLARSVVAAPAVTYAAAPAVAYAAAPVAYAAGPVAYAAGPSVVYGGQPVSITAAAGQPGLPGPVHVAPLPVDTPEVTAAKIQHFAAKNEALIRTGY
jgi:hypothetical protein